MTTVSEISRIPTSFVYQDLISKIQTVQQQMIEMENHLANQWKTNKTIENELRSRSIVFIDHVGYRTVQKCLDHEQIHQILRNYKKNYIPKYLQKWIKFGVMIRDSISPLTDDELTSTVSNFENGQEIHCYGDITIWMGHYEDYSPRKFAVPIFLTDNTEKIKMKIKEERYFGDIELRSSVINDNDNPTRKNWSEGTPLKSDDTVLSLQLFQNNSIIMAKVINNKVKYSFSYAINHDSSFF